MHYGGSGKVVANGGWHIQSILYVPSKGKIMGSKVRQTKWTSDKPSPNNPLLWKPAIYKIPYFLVEVEVLHVTATHDFFFQNRHEEFLQTCLGTLYQSLYIHQSRKATTLYAWTQHKTHSTLESLFNNVMRIVPPTNPSVMSINISL
jgi:hypothetical protein